MVRRLAETDQPQLILFSADFDGSALNEVAQTTVIESVIGTPGSETRDFGMQ